MAATVRDADEDKRFAWDNEDVQPVSLVQRNAGVVRAALRSWLGPVRLTPAEPEE